MFRIFNKEVPSQIDVEWKFNELAVNRAREIDKREKQKVKKKRREEEKKRIEAFKWAEEQLEKLRVGKEAEQKNVGGKYPDVGEEM